jgi:hypothetical protein
MSDKQQSAFFCLIVFFFASGAGLLVYKQYDAYFQEKAEIDLEAAYTAVPMSKPSATTTPAQTESWKTYKNSQYGFQMNIPQGWTESQLNGDLCFGQAGKQYIVNLGVVCGVAISIYPTNEGCFNCISAAELIRRRNMPNEIITIGGETADYETDSPDFQILVDHKGNTYRIDTLVPDQIGNEFAEIIKTFKFTN